MPQLSTMVKHQQEMVNASLESRRDYQIKGIYAHQHTLN